MYAETIAGHCRANGIRHYQTKRCWRQSEADTLHRAIFTAPVRDCTTYVVALHELGHVIANPPGECLSIADMFYGGTSPKTMRRECEAWEWALDALQGQTVSRSARAAMLTSLRSYLAIFRPEDGIDLWKRACDIRDRMDSWPVHEPRRPSAPNVHPEQLTLS